MARKTKRNSSKKDKPAKVEDAKKENEEPVQDEEQEGELEGAQTTTRKSKSSSENGVEEKRDVETNKGKKKAVGTAKSKANGVGDKKTEESSTSGSSFKGGRKRGKAAKASSRKTDTEAIPAKRSKREIKKPDVFTPSTLDSGKEWEVADIVQKREKQGRTEYLVRWKGFKLSDATWEPESNLQNCQRLIDKFNSK